MKISCKSIALIGVTLALTIMATVRAEDEKSDVPAGYEDAQQVGDPEEQAKKAVPTDKKKKSDVPTGYEDAVQAGKPRKRARRRILNAPVPQAVDNANPADDDKLFAKNPQLKALADQLRTPMQQFFGAELTFAKTVCEPNEEQFQKMKAQATPEFEKAIRVFVKQQAPMMGIQLQFARLGRRQQPQHIFDAFEKSANRIVSNVFSEETVRIYQDEQDRRKAFRAHAGAMALVAHLDTQFRLSQSQREELTDSIQQVWQREWQHHLQFMASNPQFFPQVPDESIVPHLNKVQAKQWRNMQRQQIGMHWQHLINRQFFRKIKPEIEWFEKQDKPAGGAGNVFFAVPAAVVEVAEEVKEADEEDNKE